MLTHPTIDQLRELKLDGMADAFTELSSRTPPGIWATPNGWRSCSTGRLQTAIPSASRAG